MENLKKLIDSIQKNNKLSISSNSLILGNKSQNYDRESSNYDARGEFGFPVRVTRIAEISRMSSGNPTIDELINQTIPRWYIGKKNKETYSRLINNIIDVCNDWNLINKEKYYISNKWSSELEILDKTGDYLKEKYKIRMDSITKQFQAKSIAILSEIQRVTSKINELDFKQFGMSKSEGIETISKLQTYGILYVAENEIIVPSIAQEVHGEKIDQVLQSTLSNPLNRLIYDIIKKMPGISFNKLLIFIPIDLSDEIKKIRIRSIIKDLIDSSLIFTILNDYGNDIYLTPSWLCYSLFKRLDATIITTQLLKMCFTVCSNYWEKIYDLSEVDENIQQIRIILNIILRNKEISNEEYDELPSAQRIFLRDLGKIGTIKRTLTGVKIEGINQGILDTLLLILTASYRSEMENEQIKSINFDEAIKEMSMSYEEVMTIVSTRLSLSDYKRVKGLS